MRAKPKVKRSPRPVLVAQRQDVTNLCRRSCGDTRSEWARLRRVSSRKPHSDCPPTASRGPRSTPQTECPASRLDANHGRSARRTTPSPSRSSTPQEACSPQATLPTTRSPRVHQPTDSPPALQDRPSCHQRAARPALPRPTPSDTRFDQFCNQYNLHVDPEAFRVADHASPPPGYTLAPDAWQQLQCEADQFLERFWFRVFLRHQWLLRHYQQNGRFPPSRRQPTKDDETPKEL